MHFSDLPKAIKQKQSYLCIGLDSDLEKIPSFLMDYSDPIYEFNKEIINATLPFCVSYKINTAFYEANGLKGMQTLLRTIEYLQDKDVFIIADAKRGDIGNTSAQYAKAFFESFPCDAITVNPYMGKDSVEPFLNYFDKATILLIHTSNKGSEDFQKLNSDGIPLYEHVLNTSLGWMNSKVNNLMFVVGATYPEQIKQIRTMAPNSFILVPGVGAQGGSLTEVSENGLNKECGLLINSSRGIIYADSTTYFAKVAGQEAKKIQLEMAEILSNQGILS
jgi:orotidine-5'-phosphate decarboxylase